MKTAMTTLRRPALLVALVSAALLPSCGSSNPTLVGAGSRAILSVTVEPNPVVATQNTLGSASASYTVKITETNGLGGTFVFVNGSVYDPKTGALVALNYYDATDMQVFVGSKRIEAGSTVSFVQTASYTLSDLTKAAPLVLNVQVTDDKTNLVQASALFQIQ